MFKFFASIFGSLLNCCRILWDREYMNEYGNVVMEATTGIVNSRSK